jgi:hypothetical protein
MNELRMQKKSVRQSVNIISNSDIRKRIKTHSENYAAPNLTLCFPAKQFTNLFDEVAAMSYSLGQHFNQMVFVHYILIRVTAILAFILFPYD